MNVDELERQVLGAVRREMTPDDEAIARIGSGTLARISAAPRQGKRRHAIVHEAQADSAEPRGRIANDHTRHWWGKGLRTRIGRVTVFPGAFAAAMALAIGIGGVGFAAVWVSRSVHPPRPPVPTSPAASSCHSATASSHKRPPGRALAASSADPGAIEVASVPAESPRMDKETCLATPSMSAVSPGAILHPTSVDRAATLAEAARFADTGQLGPQGQPAPSVSVAQPWNTAKPTKPLPGSHGPRSKERPDVTTAIVGSPACAGSESHPASDAIERPAARSEDLGPVIAPHASAGPDWALEELRMLREADRALRSGNPGIALHLLDQLAYKIPGGRLGEEREAVRILAMCASAPGARVQVDAVSFLRSHEASMYAGRIAETCKLDSDRRDGSH